MVDSIRDEYPFEGKFLKVGGHRLHYLDEGDPSKPVLLMVHGNPTWSYYWRKLVRDLSRDYRVVVPDHMGCGLSDKPQDYAYTLSRHIENLTALVGSLDLRDFTLFVHDWGGAIGMGYAVDHPERIRSLVVFNTAAFPSERIPLRIAACRIPGFGTFAVRGLNGFARAATLMATAKGMSREVKRGYLYPYDSYANRVANHEFVRDIPMSPSHRSWDRLVRVEEGLPRLAGVPMILLWGGKDWCFDRSFLRTWQEKFPDAETEVYEDAGHYVVEDATDRIIPRVRGFLDGVARGTARGT